MHILIVSDMAAVREGLRILLSDEPDMEVIGEARHEADVLQLVGEARPEVVLIDIDTSGGDGLRLIPQIKARESPPGIVATSIYADEAGRRRALQAGVDRFVDKSQLPAELVQSLRAAGRPAPG